jgi:hypothetical protein
MLYIQDTVKGIDDDADKKKAKEEAQTDYEKTLTFLVDAIGNKKISKAEVYADVC